MKTLSLLAVFVLNFLITPCYASDIIVDFSLAHDEAVIIRQAGKPIYLIDGCQQPTQVISLSYDNPNNIFASRIKTKISGAGTEFGFPLKETKNFIASFMPNNEIDDILSFTFTIEVTTPTIITFRIEKYATDQTSSCFLKQIADISF